MELNEYQRLAHRTALYPIDAGITYTVLGLVNESGEVAGKLKKWIRGDIPDGPNLTDILEAELGDVLWYLAETCTLLNLDLQQVAYNNIEKLSDRANRDVIRGSGDNR
jgi:NTP pyrophosphatase (non-canonical NTP hydrolase)